MDEVFNVSLLEVNAVSRDPEAFGRPAELPCQCPDFAQTGEELQGVIDHLFKCTLNQVVLPFFRRLDGEQEKLEDSMQQLGVSSDGLKHVMTMEISRAW